MKKAAFSVFLLFWCLFFACAMDSEAYLPIFLSLDAAGGALEVSAVPSLEEDVSHPLEEMDVPDSYLIENFPLICQLPEFPTGCESVSAVMMLSYWGENISVSRFVDNYLEKSDGIYIAGGRSYGADPYEVFVGSPRNTYSFGCMAPVICNALESAVGSKYEIWDLTGMSLEEICARYVSQDRPVLIWATMSMIAPYKSVSWYLPSGKLYSWLANEHCLVLVGYDETHYTFADPLKGKIVKYRKDLVNLRYDQLGNQAVSITEKKK